jgi:hypothetical protein
MKTNRRLGRRLCLAGLEVTPSIGDVYTTLTVEQMCAQIKTGTIHIIVLTSQGDREFLLEDIPEAQIEGVKDAIRQMAWCLQAGLTDLLCAELHDTAGEE